MNEINKIHIEYVKVDDLIPYANNPRNNDDAVEYVARSIEKVGFKVPMVIDKDNVIITGHTRLKAARMLGYEEVPCIRADDLSEEEIKLFRIADNRVSEFATWDYDKLDLELEDLAEMNVDLGDLGLDFTSFLDEPVNDDMEDNPEDMDYKDEDEDYERDLVTQDRCENILNLGKGKFEGCGKYDIPIIRPVTELPPIKEWIGFNYVLSDDNPEGKAVHFFVHDYQFERLWNNPEKYIDKLKRYVCVATPDFSPYSDMPMVCQLFNHYRKHWVGAWLQRHGVTVIPTIRRSADKRSLKWFLDGEPKNGIIIISSMWSKEFQKESKEAYEIIKQKLNPVKIFIYGGKGHMDIDEDENVEYIKNFLQGRYGG